MIEFHKMSGTGNDFIVIDNREAKYKSSDTTCWKNLCARRTGIGADGVLLLGAGKAADFRLEIINADGSIGEMCANGARCLAAFAHNTLKLKKQNLYQFETLNSVYEASVDGTFVDLKMTEQRALNSIDLAGLCSHSPLGYIDTGVPHCVFEVDDLEQVDVEELGETIRSHERFGRAGCNVNFIEVEKDKTVFIRTYERGVEGETLSCGTGVTATGILLVKRMGNPERIDFCTRGGPMALSFKDDGIWLCGGTEMIYSGMTELN